MIVLNYEQFGADAWEISWNCSEYVDSLTSSNIGALFG